MTTLYSERDYTFGQRMLKLRKEIGLTQERLGKLLHVTGRAVSEWETGSSYPKAENLKALITLAVQQQAFAVGHEAEEIRVLWKAAHPKELLDEHWLSTVLSQQRFPHPHVEPELVEETMSTSPIGEQTCGNSEQEERKGCDLSLPTAPPSLDACPAETTGVLPPLPDLVAGSEPRTTIGAVGTGQRHGPTSETDKTRGRRKWLLRILIALVILTIIGSAGTLYFQARDGATTQANKAYPEYLFGKGTLAFFDPLSQESGSQWRTSKTNAGGLCQFTGGAYHAVQQQTSYLNSCSAYGIFGNFALEVQLTIVQGDCGGIVFRDQGHNRFYSYRISQDGQYYARDPNFLLHSNRSAAIHIGLGKQNKIAVVASGSTIVFYVNEQPVDQEQDRNPTSGPIGLIAFPNDHATDVAYSNARLWTL